MFVLFHCVLGFFVSQYWVALIVFCWLCELLCFPMFPHVSPCSVSLCLRSFVFVSHQQRVLFSFMLGITAKGVVSPHVFVHVL